MQFLKVILICFSVQLGYAAFNFFDPTVAAQIPANISATGMYSNIISKTTSAELVFYDINTPYWTDGTYKKRWIVLPTGTQVVYDDTTDYFTYPDGAVLIKNFYLDTVPGDASTSLLIETRFLVHKIGDPQKDWYPITYKWSGNDATLVPEKGIKDTLSFYPNGIAAAPTLMKWEFQARSRCADCHRVETSPVHGRTIGSFIPAQLNGDFSHKINQLQHLFDINVFAPLSPMPDFSKSPKWARITDASADLNIRGRSYIAANCSGCHGTRGNAVGAVFGPRLDYDFHTMVPKMEFRDRKLTQEFQIPDGVLVAPGEPERSIILVRQMDRKADLAKYFSTGMPPYQTYRVDSVALDTLAKWITLMEPLAVVENISEERNFIFPKIVNGIIMLPQELRTERNKISLYNLKGKVISLLKVNSHQYALRGSQPPGVYFLKASEKIYFLHMGI